MWGGGGGGGCKRGGRVNVHIIAQISKDQLEPTVMERLPCTVFSSGRLHFTIHLLSILRAQRVQHKRIPPLLRFLNSVVGRVSLYIQYSHARPLP